MKKIDKVTAANGDIVSDVFAQMSYEPELAYNIKTLAYVWKQFCTQDQDTKNTLERIDGAGYELKVDPDYKEILHLKIGYELPKKTTHLNKVLFNLTKEIFVQIMPLIFSICHDISLKTGTSLKQMVEESKDQLVIRFLHYFPIEGGKSLAADPHIDKGLFTIHLWEDLPGLQILWNGMWFNVEPCADHVLFYPGLIGQYHTGCEIKAACHQVVANSEMSLHGRYAMVMFVDGGNKKSDKGKKGSTQGNFNNGQNYTMSVLDLEEFLIETSLAVD